MAHHDLKAWPCYFQPVVDGHKLFEIRFNRDRHFKKGDTFTLHETNPDEGLYQDPLFTGRLFHGVITYVTDFKQKHGFVVFGFKERAIQKQTIATQGEG